MATNNNCPRIYFLVPITHPLNHIVKTFENKRRAALEKWIDFKEKFGGKSFYANDRLVGLMYEDKLLVPKGWHSPAKFDDTAYAPHAGRKGGKEAMSEMLALPAMKGGADLSHKISKFLDIKKDQSYAGGYTDKVNESGGGFMVHYIGYERHGDFTILTVPDFATAPKELKGLELIKQSQYWAIVEEQEHVNEQSN